MLADLFRGVSGGRNPGSSADEVFEKIVELERRQVQPRPGWWQTPVVAGRMYVEEVQKRYPYAFEAAKKTEKYEHVRLMNDDLRGGFAKLMAGSPYAEEIAALPKQQPWPDPENPEAAPKEHPLFPNHCCDAGLYAYRGAMHYLHREAAPEIKPKTPEWFVREEARIIERLQKRKNEAEPWLNRYDDDVFTMADDE